MNFRVMSTPPQRFPSQVASFRREFVRLTPSNVFFWGLAIFVVIVEVATHSLR